MTKPIKRYDLEGIAHGYDVVNTMVECEDGDWVSYDDYAELAAENNRLKDAIFAVANVNPVIPGSTLAAAVELASGDDGQ